MIPRTQHDSSEVTAQISRQSSGRPPFAHGLKLSLPCPTALYLLRIIFMGCILPPSGLGIIVEQLCWKRCPCRVPSWRQDLLTNLRIPEVRYVSRAMESSSSIPVRFTWKLDCIWLRLAGFQMDSRSAEEGLKPQAQGLWGKLYLRRQPKKQGWI